MAAAYEQLLHDMAITLEKLENKVPPPQKVPFAGTFVFHYVERTGQQAIVQKLARIITGLRAALVLLRNGLLQEHCAIERILDELSEPYLWRVLLSRSAVCQCVGQTMSSSSDTGCLCRFIVTPI